MNSGFKAYQINDLAALQTRAGAKITGAIKNASAQTGVDFSYLLKQAGVESSFNPTAKAKGSTASGLYQFIESTWLSMVNKHGDKYGLSEYADKISDSGKVASRADRKEILDLRKDPRVAALMAGEYASENKAYLEDRTGGDVGSTELYMAHFMGPGGAANFLSAMDKNPNAKGAALFSREACSNPAIFYTASGKAKSLSEIYAYFDGKFDGSGSAPSSAPSNEDIQLAAAVAPKPSYAAGYGKFEGFNENTGKWFKTSNKIFAPSEERYAALETAKSGAIPGSRLVANPIDIIALLEFGQPTGENKAKGDSKGVWGSAFG